MAALQIHYDEESGWIASVANSGVAYRFVADEVGEQAVAVQQLAVAMQEGNAALLEGIPEIFDIPPEVEIQEVVGDLFCMTDEMMFAEEMIYAAVGEEMLIDDLELAGEALARVLIR